MNILLVNISLRPESHVKMFPVGLGYIATAIKRSGYVFDLLDIDGYRYSDQEVDDYLQSKSYDVVCFGCIVTGYRIVKDLSKRIRIYQPESTIVAGNTVASSVPDILLKNTEVDVAVMGEGDETIVCLLECLEKKDSLEKVEGICFKQDEKIIRTPARKIIENLDLLPSIDYDIFDVEIYIENIKKRVPDSYPIPRSEVRGLPINTARGCVGRCTFCYHAFQNDVYRQLSVGTILREVQRLIKAYQINAVSFQDELTFCTKKHVMEFVQMILDMGLKFYWGCQCRAGLFNCEEDLEIMALMKQAGCASATFALESSDQRILEMMRKKISVSTFSYQAQLFQEAGIPVHTSLVFGYPQETPETIRNTFDVCIENSIYPSIGYLLPQPGSGMYEYALEMGYIPDEEKYLLSMGDRQDLLINMTKMSDEVFVSEVKKGAKRCSEALGVGLKEENLIKTGFYRSGKKVAQS